MDDKNDSFHYGVINLSYSGSSDEKKCDQALKIMASSDPGIFTMKGGWLCTKHSIRLRDKGFEQLFDLITSGNSSKVSLEGRAFRQDEEPSLMNPIGKYSDFYQTPILERTKEDAIKRDLVKIAKKRLSEGVIRICCNCFHFHASSYVDDEVLEEIKTAALNKRSEDIKKAVKYLTEVRAYYLENPELYPKRNENDEDPFEEERKKEGLDKLEWLYKKTKEYLKSEKKRKKVLPNDYLNIYSIECSLSEIEYRMKNRS